MENGVTPALVLRRDKDGYLEMEPDWRCFPFGKAYPRLDIQHRHSCPENSLGACLAEWFGGGRFRFVEDLKFFTVLKKFGAERHPLFIGDKSYLLLKIASQFELLIDERGGKNQGIFHKPDSFLKQAMVVFMPEGSHNELFLKRRIVMDGIPLFVGHPCFDRYFLNSTGKCPQSLLEVVDEVLAFRRPAPNGHCERHDILCHDGQVRSFEVEVPIGMTFDPSILTEEDVNRMSSFVKGEFVSMNVPPKRCHPLRF